MHLERMEAGLWARLELTATENYICHGTYSPRSETQTGILDHGVPFIFHGRNRDLYAGE